MNEQHLARRGRHPAHPAVRREVIVDNHEVAALQPHLERLAAVHAEARSGGAEADAGTSGGAGGREVWRRRGSERGGTARE